VSWAATRTSLTGYFLSPQPYGRIAAVEPWPANCFSIEQEDSVRFINLYFVGYVVLLVGLLLGLWYAGVLQTLAPAWVAIGLVIAIGIGIMLAVSAGKPPTIMSS
jgi:hypothetical protein